jgi:triosephosphate isomerase
MRPITVIGNWKMNGSQSACRQWIEAVCAEMEKGMPAGRRFGLCPPYPYLSECSLQIASRPSAGLFLGAQDISAEIAGAFTGEVSAAMLHEFGCKYVLVGHSERRDRFNESDQLIAEKALQALDHGLTPVICVGEKADERNSGRAVEVVRSQVARQIAILQDRLVDSLIAYEPVWAIGTGKVASAQIAQDMHREIRLQLAEFDADVASHVGILYGGSVRFDNAVELFGMPDIDGGLIGGASLDPHEFLAICRA